MFHGVTYVDIQLSVVCIHNVAVVLIRFALLDSLCVWLRHESHLTFFLIFYFYFAYELKVICTEVPIIVDPAVPHCLHCREKQFLMQRKNLGMAKLYLLHPARKGMCPSQRLSILISATLPILLIINVGMRARCMIKRVDNDSIEMVAPWPFGKAKWI